MTGNKMTVVVKFADDVDSFTDEIKQHQVQTFARLAYTTASGVTASYDNFTNTAAFAHAYIDGVEDSTRELAFVVFETLTNRIATRNFAANVLEVGHPAISNTEMDAPSPPPPPPPSQPPPPSPPPLPPSPLQPPELEQGVFAASMIAILLPATILLVTIFWLAVRCKCWSRLRRRVATRKTTKMVEVEDEALVSVVPEGLS